MKIQQDGIPFCGRSAELEVLETLWAKTLSRSRTNTDPRTAAASPSTASPSILVLEGSPGIGKTAILDKFVDRVMELPSSSQGSSKGGPPFCCVGRGVFDQSSADTDPWTALDQLTVQLLEMFMEQQKAAAIAPASTKFILDQMRKSLLPQKSEWKPLELAFPAVQLFFDKHGSSHATVATGETSRSEQRQNSSQNPLDIYNGHRWTLHRLAFAWRDIIKNIASQSPVLLIFEDMQWAPESSLFLVQKVIDMMVHRSKKSKETTHPQILLVFSHRTVDEGHWLNHWESESIPEMMVQHLRLENLPMDDVSKMLHAVLKRSDIQSFAYTAYTKTFGNPLSILKYLVYLEDNDLLVYSQNASKWTWNLAKIRVETFVIQNAIDLVLAHIRSVSQDQREALSVAACLGGTSFTTELLLNALNSIDKQESLFPIAEKWTSTHFISKDHLQATLQEAAYDDLLEMVSESEFRFAHNQIREAFYSLLPEGSEREMVHVVIGRRLLAYLAKVPTPSTLSITEQADSLHKKLLLQALRQISMGSKQLSSYADSASLHDLVDWYYQAAEDAARRVAYGLAADLIQRGMALLGDSKYLWAHEYSLMVQLAQALACAECFGHRFAQGVLHADQILKNTSSFQEQAAAYQTKIICLIAQRRNEQAVESARGALEQLGVSFPRRTKGLPTTVEYLRTKKMLNVRNNLDVIHVPKAPERLHAIAKLLERIDEVASYEMDKDLDTIVTFKSMQWILEYGRNYMAPYAFIAWGGYLASLGDRNTGYGYGKIGLTHAGNLKGDVSAIRSTNRFNLQLLHLRQPFEECSKYASKAVSKLWAQGAIETVLVDTGKTLWLSFCAGSPLEILEKEARNYINLLKDYNIKSLYLVNEPFFEMIFNLKERYDRSWQKKATKDRTRKMDAYGMDFFCLITAYFYVDIDSVKDLSIRVRHLDNHDKGSIWFTYRYFFLGMAQLALYRESEKRQHIREGRIILRHIESIVEEEGNNNATPLMLVMKAEYMAVSKKFSVQHVLTAFDEAISVTGKSFITHIQALACERAGLFCLSHYDTVGATPYLSKARKLYVAWGAYAKADHVSASHKALFSRSFSPVALGGASLVDY